ncbi:hypothetical protein IFM47457_02739 [Aspergillus lentulus]|nr:hypothetical protein IFM47457_02739 [Aspergillus lentulus]
MGHAISKNCYERGDIRIQQDGERIDEDEKMTKLLLKEELERSEEVVEESKEMEGWMEERTRTTVIRRREFIGVFERRRTMSL